MKIVYLAVFALLFSCNKVQNSKSAIGSDKVDANVAGLRSINVDSQLTIFGVTRGVFTANENSICVDRITPGDVWPLLLRIKDANSPAPSGIPSETESKIPNLQGGEKNVNINVQVENPH